MQNFFVCDSYMSDHDHTSNYLLIQWNLCTYSLHCTALLYGYFLCTSYIIPIYQYYCSSSKSKTFHSSNIKKHDWILKMLSSWCFESFLFCKCRSSEQSPVAQWCGAAAFWNLKSKRPFDDKWFVRYKSCCWQTQWAVLETQIAHNYTLPSVRSF